MVKKFMMACVLAMVSVVLAGNPSGINPRFVKWQKMKAAGMLPQQRKTAVQSASALTPVPKKKLMTKAMSVSALLAAESAEDVEPENAVIPEVFNLSYLNSVNAKSSQPPVGGFPARYDLRDEGRLTSAKAQGKWNTCWAFASCGALESAILSAGGGTYDFSEKHIVDNHGYDFSVSNGGSFLAERDDTLAAVGFYALVPNTSVNIEIYRLSSDGVPTSPISDELLLKQPGVTLKTAGYVTVPLDDYVEISSGDRFSVVLKVTTPGYKTPLAIERPRAETGTTKATGYLGESFYSSSGNKAAWRDFSEIGSQYSGSSFCCKVYGLGDEYLPMGNVASLVADGPLTIAAGKSGSFSLTQVYENGERWPSSDFRVEYDSPAIASVSYSGDPLRAVVSVRSDLAENTDVIIRLVDFESGLEREYAFTATKAAPPPPTGLAATTGEIEDGVRISWSGVEGVETYKVYRASGANAASGSATFIGDVAALFYTDTTAAPGVDYTYFVKSFNNSGASVFASGVTGWRKLAPPTVNLREGLAAYYPFDGNADDASGNERHLVYQYGTAPESAADRAGKSGAAFSVSGYTRLANETNQALAAVRGRPGRALASRRHHRERRRCARPVCRRTVREDRHPHGCREVAARGPRRLRRQLRRLRRRGGRRLLLRSRAGRQRDRRAVRGGDASRARPSDRRGADGCGRGGRGLCVGVRRVRGRRGDGLLLHSAHGWRRHGRQPRVHGSVYGGGQCHRHRLGGTRRLLQLAAGEGSGSRRVDG